MTLVGKDLKPGTSKEAYAFEINKDAEVDVAYQVAIVQEGELLASGTPVKIILQNLVNDNNYAGKEGKIKITVNANQIINSPFVPNITTVNKPLSITWDMCSVMIYVGTDVNPNYNLTKDINYYKNEKGLNILDVGNINLNYVFGGYKKGSVDMQNVVFTQKEAGSTTYIASCSNGNWNGNEFTITIKDWISQSYLNHYRDITLAKGDFRVHFDASAEEISWFSN